MAITYHAGRRIQATQADFDGTPAISGGWKELGRTTASGGGTDVTVSSLSDKRYYMILSSWTMSTSAQSRWRFNNDSGNNYSGRYSGNGGSDGTATSQSSIPYNNPGYDLTPHWNVGYIANKSDKEKLWINNQIYQNTAGAGTAPGRQEQTCKWANTSDVINEIRLNSSAGTYDSGSELVVLGYDPDDTHTSNFWEELADVTTGSTGALSSGTFTAKKYLWIQAYTPSSSNASPDGYVEFNADSGSNYAHRRSHNGGSDTTGTSDGVGIRIDGSGGQTAKFHNMFIVNNSANEKLVICNSITQQTAGAGNIPTRTESVGKWVNTSDQITRVDIIDQYASDQWGAGSFIKVWGSN